MAKRFVSRAPKKPKRSKVIIFLNVLIGILTAMLLFAVIGVLGDNRDSYYNRKFGDSSSGYALDRGDYADLLYTYEYDGGSIGRVNKGYEEVAAVAEYAKAAYRRGAYEKAGDTGKAAAQAQRMEKAAAGVGIYSPEPDKIEKLIDRW